MATAYRDYITEKGDITKLTADQVKADIPLYVETFGSIETTERVLSFPVLVNTPLTTFEDIKTMYSELKELGVGNVNFKLTGYANGEIYYTFVSFSTEVKRNRTLSPFQRTNFRQSAVSLIQFSYDLVFNPLRESETNEFSAFPASTSPARTF